MREVWTAVVNGGIGSVVCAGVYWYALHHGAAWSGALAVAYSVSLMVVVGLFVRGGEA